MRSLILAAVFAIAASPALADKIDGDWCYTDGRHFSIRGPEIVTDAGRRLQGDYSRHYFSYVVPAPDGKAGAVVRMALANEETIYLTVGTDGPTETWKRCSPTS